MSAWQRPTLPGPRGPSTIGAGGLNGRVRDGYAWFPSAIITKRCAMKMHGNQGYSLKTGTKAIVRISPRPIRIRQLNVLPRVHLGPIYLVIYKGSYFLKNGKSQLEGGFTLRCFQRLARPYVATQRCSWRNNWYTSGTSIPVLSYFGQLLSELHRPRQIGTELCHDVLHPAHGPP